MDENQITYETMQRVFKKLNEKGISAYLIGGISAAIQADVDLYRKNDDLDIMINTDDLPSIIEALKEINYTVEDKRKNLTENKVDVEGNFTAHDHELNSHTTEKLLGVGIFTYERKDGKVYTHSYAYHEKEDKFIGYEHEMPERLFDLMYDTEEKEYHGVNVRCQTKTYTYLKKKEGTREKDKQDAEVVEKTLTPGDMIKIDEIRRLEKTVISYLVEYDKDGKEISRERIPNFEEKLEMYINSVREKNIGMSDQEIKQIILESDFAKKIIESDKDAKEIMERWKNSASEEDIAVNAKEIAHNYLNETDTDKIFSMSVEQETPKKENARVR